MLLRESAWYVWSHLGALANHDGDNNEEATKKKVLMDGTIAQHVYFKTLNISKLFSTKQDREIAKTCVVWQRKTRRQIF